MKNKLKMDSRIARHRAVMVGSQEAAAKALGVSQPFWSRLESGKCLPSLTFAKRMANLLGVTLDQLHEMIEEAKSGGG